MLNRFFDNRLTRLFILISGIYLAVQSSKNLLTLWSAKSRVDQAQARLSQLQKENEILSLQVQEAEKPEFIRNEARDKLGLVRENEVVLVLPQDQVQKLADSLREEYLAIAQNVSPDLPNWQKWLKLFTD